MDVNYLAVVAAALSSFLLGGLFVLITLFLPYGIASLLRRLKQNSKPQTPSATQESAG